MPQKLIDCKDIVMKKNWNPHEPIATIFHAVKELLDFINITVTLYKQHQAVNIAYVIIHRTGPTVQKTLVGFKHFFRTAYLKLRETAYLAMQDAGMHHANMVRDVVAVLQEVLQKEQYLTKTPMNAHEPHKHVVNALQDKHYQLVA